LKINSEILKKWLGDAVPAPSNHGSTLGDSGSALWSKEIASERSQRVFLRSNLRNITKALFQSLRKKAKELSREQTRETKLKHFSSCFEKKKKKKGAFLRLNLAKHNYGSPQIRHNLELKSLHKGQL
jgi:23S rRNA G2445 N2-methylase RlmL